MAVASVVEPDDRYAFTRRYVTTALQRQHMAENIFWYEMPNDRRRTTATGAIPMYSKAVS